MSALVHEQELRLRALELAVKVAGDVDQVVPLAQAMVTFVTGDKTPRETIDAALDRAGVC